MAGKHVQKTSRLLGGSTALSGKQAVQKIAVTTAQLNTLKKLAAFLELANEKGYFQSKTGVGLAD